MPALSPARVSSRTPLRRHDLVGFFALTFLLTWVVWVPRALGAPVGVLDPLWTWMPAVAALLWAALLHGRAGVRDLGQRLVRWRVGWSWYAVVLLAPFAFALAVAGIGVLLGRPWSGVRPEVLTLGVPTAVAFLLVLVLTDGLGEELAWRGYALPRLLERRGPVAASLLLGGVWWLWHLPLVWTPGKPLVGMPVWLLLADLLAKSLLFTAVFLRTRESVLVAVLLHATTNLFAVSPVVGPDGDLLLPLVALGLKVLLAAGVVLGGGLTPPHQVGAGRGPGPRAG